MNHLPVTAEIGSKTCIVGDDIFVTNKTRVCEGIELGVCEFHYN